MISHKIHIGQIPTDHNRLHTFINRNPRRDPNAGPWDTSSIAPSPGAAVLAGRYPRRCWSPDVAGWTNAPNGLVVGAKQHHGRGDTEYVQVWCTYIMYIYIYIKYNIINIYVYVIEHMYVYNCIYTCFCFFFSAQIPQITLRSDIYWMCIYISYMHRFQIKQIHV